MIPSQHIDGEFSGRDIFLEATGLARQAEQHQRRVQRDRIERIHGDAQPVAIGPDGRDDGHAGREAPHGIAEGPCIQAHRQKFSAIIKPLTMICDLSPTESQTMHT